VTIELASDRLPTPRQRVRRRPGPAPAWIGLVLFSVLSIAGCSSDSGDASVIFVEVSKIVASDGQEEDHFGMSVALEGEHLIAGGVLGGSSERGFVYIYRRTERDSSRWSQVRKVRGADTTNMDSFGCSVAISGDYVVVGAMNADSGFQDSGAAYVFFRNEGGTDQWGQQKRLAAEDPDWSDGFGRSVAIDGDYIVVGAPYKSGDYYESGAVYVFYRHKGGENNWGQVKKIEPSDPRLLLDFGRDVAIDGDLVLVGAANEAHLFGRNQPSADQWGEVKKLVGSDTVNADDFGNAVSISGGTAVVGAHYRPGGGEYRGAAYVFARDQGGAGVWGEVRRLTASDAHDMDEFGYDVAIHGDSLIIGAMYAADLFNSQGAVYFYARNRGGEDNWGEANKAMSSDTEDGDILGSCVGIGENCAVAGAPGEDGPDEDRGAVYIFKKTREL